MKEGKLKNVLRAEENKTREVKKIIIKNKRRKK